MIRPPLEVADIIRSHGSAFVERHHRWLSVLHLKVLRAIGACRTAALGGHVEQCDRCGQRAISYNSCLNRHCPKCQAAARQRWLEKRSAELLPVPYYHVVFTLPHVLAPLALQNKALVYGLLFRAAAQTLLQIAADPKHLGAEIGFLAVLHTWGQTLLAHPHVHCVVPGGGLSPDHQTSIPCGHNFFLPVNVLSVVFRGKFLAALQRAFQKHKLTLAGLHVLPACCWPSSSLNTNLVASKTGSPGVIAMTLSARFSPSVSHHIRLSSTIHNPRTIQNT